MAPPSSSRRRVIFLNRFFYPDTSPTSELLSALAFALARHGSRVTVITSRLNYSTGTAALPPRETNDGVDIWRVRTSNLGGQRLIGRSFDYVSFYVAAGWRLCRGNSLDGSHPTAGNGSRALCEHGRARATFEQRWEKERSVGQWEEVLNVATTLRSDHLEGNN